MGGVGVHGTVTRNSNMLKSLCNTVAVGLFTGPVTLFICQPDERRKKCVVCQ